MLFYWWFDSLIHVNTVFCILSLSIIHFPSNSCQASLPPDLVKTSLLLFINRWVWLVCLYVNLCCALEIEQPTGTTFLKKTDSSLPWKTPAAKAPQQRQDFLSFSLSICAELWLAWSFGAYTLYTVSPWVQWSYNVLKPLSLQHYSTALTQFFLLRYF